VKPCIGVRFSKVLWVTLLFSLALLKFAHLKQTLIIPMPAGFQRAQVQKRRLAETYLPIGLTKAKRYHLGDNILIGSIKGNMGECVLKIDIKPWHQLPCESDKAYRTFCLFLNMGRQRSLNKLAIMINKLTTYERPLFVDQLGLSSCIFAWTKRADLCERFVQNELLTSDIHQRGDRTSQ